MHEKGGPAFLPMYAPALLQYNGGDLAGALQVLAEILRQARVLWPLDADAADDTVLVMLDALKERRGSARVSLMGGRCLGSRPGVSFRRCLVGEFGALDSELHEPCWFRVGPPDRLQPPSRLEQIGAGGPHARATPNQETRLRHEIPIGHPSKLRATPDEPLVEPQQPLAGLRSVSASFDTSAPPQERIAALLITPPCAKIKVDSKTAGDATLGAPGPCARPGPFRGGAADGFLIGRQSVHDTAHRPCMLCASRGPRSDGPCSAARGLLQRRLGLDGGTL